MLSGVQPGSIILFHNAALHTPEALPDIIDSLMQEGYTFVTVNDLIPDPDGRLHHRPHRPAVPRGMKQFLKHRRHFLSAVLFRFIA